MTFTEFKNHINKRFTVELGFLIIEDTCFYSNDEIRIILNIQKSFYFNRVYAGIGVTPKEGLNNRNTGTTTIFELSKIRSPLSKGTVLYPLDEIDLSQLDEIIDDFSANIFPHLITCEKLYEYCKDDYKDLMPHVKEFWY